MNRLAFKTNLTASRIIPRISEEGEVAKTMEQNVMLNDFSSNSQTGKLKAEIEFNNVGFRYHPGEEDILKNLNF